MQMNGKEACIVTQNIDNFHNQIKAQRISKNKKIKDYPIHQIHGNILSVRCDHCSKQDNKLYTEPFESYFPMIEMTGKLICPRCEGNLRPHIMFFDEFYEEVLNHSETVNKFLKQADTVVVIGTALQTGMANSIVQSALEADKVII